MTKTLRTWQQTAFSRYWQAKLRIFVIEAVMGAGKTFLAAYLLHQRRLQRLSKRLVVVTPTRHLKRQWAKTLAQFGLHLDHEYDTSQTYEGRDYHGIITTYAQVAKNWRCFQQQCQWVDTDVVLDEVHHCGDTKAWGDAIVDAFGKAAFVMPLTGTPIRSDNNPIPFLTYRDGVMVPDYAYTYADGLRDGVVRPVAFIPYGGDLSWSEGGVEFHGSIDRYKSAKFAQRCLSVALDVNSGWLDTMIRDADLLLDKIRREQLPNAGGLIVTKSIEHCKEVARVVERVTGVKSAIVVSDSKTSTTTIKAFEHSRDKWLVAVKKVSEGVDIPRLRVGVFATNTLTEMYFRQWFGRFVRTKYGNEPSYCFIPADPRLLKMARAAEEERRHVLRDELLTMPGNGALERDFFGAHVTAIGSVNSGFEMAIVNGNSIQMGLFGTPANIGGLADTVQSIVGSGVAEMTMTETRKGLRTDITRAVNRLARKRRCEQREVWAMINRMQGVKQANCTLAQLQERREILARWESG